MALQNAQPTSDARQRLSGTLDEIEARLNPRRLMADGLGRVAASSGHLAAAARAHPLALAAAAVAVGLTLFTSRRLSKARVDMGDELGDYTDYDDGFGFADTAPESPSEPRRRAEAEPEAEAPSNPLVSILIGLAAGAALGAIFPATETERQVLGDAGSRLGDAARAAARRAVGDIGAATRR